MELDLIKLLFGFILAFDLLLYYEIMKLKRKTEVTIKLDDMKYKTQSTMGYHLYVEYKDDTQVKQEDIPTFEEKDEKIN